MKFFCVWLLGLLVGFLVLRYFAKRGRGHMKLCDECDYKQCYMVNNDIDVTPANTDYCDGCFGSDDGFCQSCGHNKEK